MLDHCLRPIRLGAIRFCLTYFQAGPAMRLLASYKPYTTSRLPTSLVSLCGKRKSEEKAAQESLPSKSQPSEPHSSSRTTTVLNTFAPTAACTFSRRTTSASALFLICQGIALTLWKTKSRAGGGTRRGNSESN